MAIIGTVFLMTVFVMNGASIADIKYFEIIAVILSLLCTFSDITSNMKNKKRLCREYMLSCPAVKGEVINYYSQPEYVDITTSPLGDILITDGYGIELLVNSKVDDKESIDVPVHPDNLRFAEWKYFENYMLRIFIMGKGNRFILGLCFYGMD